MAASYAIRTFGCQMNEHDSERIAGILEADGYVRAPVLEEADVIVLNTCCIREKADNKLYSALGNLKSVKEKRPGTRIAVAGCLAQKDRDLIVQRASHVDVVFGTHNVHRAAHLLDHAASHGSIVEILEESARDDAETFPSALTTRREDKHRAWVTIQIGCDNSCAFCIVPSVRGPEISRPFGELVNEVKLLATKGVHEVTLLGQNVNSYGRDLALARRAASGQVASDEDMLYGTTRRAASAQDDDAWWCGSNWKKDRRARPLFADLLRAVGEVPGIRRVRFTSPHPKDIRSDTIAAMAEVPSVCEHLHLPLQSGSDVVLKSMRRGYTAKRYLQKLADARASIPDLAVSTDIIVGFPGETEKDFESTLEVVAEARYDSAFTFIFSPRPGTLAADYQDRFVPREVMNERYQRLRHVVQRSSSMSNRLRVGRVEEVFLEGPSKKNSSVFTGRTRRNTLVHFPFPEPSQLAKSSDIVEFAGSSDVGLSDVGSSDVGSSDVRKLLQTGAYADVQVTDAAATHLKGEFVRLTRQAPRVRARIPVIAV